MPQATLERPEIREQVPAPRSGRRSTLGAKDRTFGFMIALPAVLLFLVIAIFPLVSSIGTSLYNQSLLRPERTFVGLDNYGLIWDEFVARLGTTLVFASLSTVFPLVLGVALAMLLNARMRGRTILRGALMLPWLLPGVVVSFLWAWIFNDSYGVVNHVLEILGQPPISMLGNPVGAMAAVVIAKTWHSFPWIMVVALAVLQTLPSEQIEAATIDGATPRPALPVHFAAAHRRAGHARRGARVHLQLRQLRHDLRHDRWRAGQFDHDPRRESLPPRVRQL